MKSGKRPKLLYFYVGASTFVHKDIAILQEEFDVVSFNFHSTHKGLTPWLIFRQLIFILKYCLRASGYVCQFAGYHSVFPALVSKLTRRKCLIISGGTDCHAFPSIGYGNFQKRFLKQATSISFKVASFIAPKHESLWYHPYNYDSSGAPAQGIAHFIPGIRTPHLSIPNGYDPDKFYRNSQPTHPASFATVTSGLNYSFQTQLKGIDLILETARHLPEATFTIIGVPENQKPINSPSNVSYHPPCTSEELRILLNQSRFYLQLSLAEGFPNSLCEAMLCECIPIGSTVFSIPEIIGETGYLLKNRSSEALLQILKDALHRPKKEALSSQARDRILRNYSLNRRKSELLRLCKEIFIE